MDMLKKRFDLIIVLSIIIIGIITVLTGDIPMVTKKRNIYYEKAKVISITSEKLTDDSVVPGLRVGTQNLKLQLQTGQFKDEVYDVKNNLSRLYNVNAKPGMSLIVAVFMNGDDLENISVYSYRRDKVIYTLIALFFILLAVIGGIKGLKSILALIFTSVMVVSLMIPLIFKGVSPIVSAVTTASLSTAGTLLLLNGRERKTTAAMLGTILGVVISGFFAFAAGQLAHLSGLTMDNAESMLYIAEQSGFSIRGLMFAAILIASLGAIMDVGMSIASSIFELHSVNPEMKPKDLFTSGMNIGKDMIGTMSNTLILAFAGGSLNLIIMIVSAKMPYNQLINLDVIGTELIQGISGSIGIVLTVPITAFLSAYLVSKSKIPTKKGR